MYTLHMYTLIMSNCTGDQSYPGIQGEKGKQGKVSINVLKMSSIIKVRGFFPQISKSA